MWGIAAVRRERILLAFIFAVPLLLFGISDFDSTTSHQVMYFPLYDTGFAFPLTDDDLSLACFGTHSSSLGTSAEDYQCSEAQDHLFVTFVRAGSTFTAHSFTATILQNMIAEENCNIYFKSHDALADTRVCDAGGAGPHLCDDTGATLVPLFHTGPHTCEGNCTATTIDVEDEQIVVTPVGATSTGTWSIAAGVKRYCSTGQADSGKMCYHDNQCAGTCVAVDDASADLCANVSGLQLEMRYSITN
jgi:hypothetical protein